MDRVVRYVLFLFFASASVLPAKIEGWLYWEEFPWVYSASEGEWLSFLPEGDTLWVVHLATGEWEKVFGPEAGAPSSLVGKTMATLLESAVVLILDFLTTTSVLMNFGGNSDRGTYFYTVQSGNVARFVINILDSNYAGVFVGTLTFDSSTEGTIDLIISGVSGEGNEPVQETLHGIFTIQ